MIPPEKLLEWEREAQELIATRTHTDCGLAEADRRLIVCIAAIREQQEWLRTKDLLLQKISDEDIDNIAGESAAIADEALAIGKESELP